MSKSLNGFKRAVSSARSLSDKVKAVNYCRSSGNSIKYVKNPSPQKIAAIEKAFKKTATTAKTATAFLKPKDNLDRAAISKGLKTKTKGLKYIPVTVGQGTAKLGKKKNGEREIKFDNDNFGEFDLCHLDTEYLNSISDDVGAIHDYIMEELNNYGANENSIITPAYAWNNTRGFYFGMSYSYSNIDDMISNWISNYVKYGEENVSLAFAISDINEMPDFEDREEMEFAEEINEETERQEKAKKKKPKNKKAKTKEIAEVAKKAIKDKIAADKKEIARLERKLKRMK